MRQIALLKVFLLVFHEWYGITVIINSIYIARQRQICVIYYMPGLT